MNAIESLSPALDRLSENLQTSRALPPRVDSLFGGTPGWSRGGGRWLVLYPSFEAPGMVEAVVGNRPTLESWPEDAEEGGSVRIQPTADQRWKIGKHTYSDTELATHFFDVVLGGPPLNAAR